MKTRSREVELALKAFEQMEEMITDMLDWADVLVSLGVGPNKVEPGAMRLIGGAMNALADDMRSRWDVIEARKEMMR